MFTKKLLCALIILVSTSQLYHILAIDDIPSHYISTKPLKSLFCNTCSVLSSVVNETLYDENADFETYLGFRLDSNGKKIRKQSGWIKLFLSLEDVCDDWKDKYRTAKRKNGYLYLIESEVVRAMEKIERNRKEKLEKEASDRLNKKWDQEWEIEKLQQERKWNETHDEDGNLIQVNDTDDASDSVDASDSYQEGTQTDENESDNNEEKEAKDRDKEENDGEENDGDENDDQDNDNEKEEDEIKRYFYEKKPKLVKRKAKQHKIVKEMCYFLSEKYDEWLHEQQKIVSKQIEEGGKISDYFKPIDFCLEDDICKKSMFDIKPKIFKFKKELRLPKKPKRTWTPPQPQESDEDDYEAGEEDDVDEDTDDVDVDIDINDSYNDNESNDNNDKIENNENNVNNDNDNDDKPKSEL